MLKRTLILCFILSFLQVSCKEKAPMNETEKAEDDIIKAKQPPNRCLKWQDLWGHDSAKVPGNWAIERDPSISYCGDTVTYPISI